jgi:small subunit ribosomal protein S27Ae
MEAKGKEKKEKEFKKYKQSKPCPKCGVGMGEHSDRYSCGHCGYTEFRSQKQKEKA